MRILRALLATVAISSLVACGGGGSDDSTSKSAGSVSGLVAIGAAVPNAEVSVRDVNGQVITGTADANGQYNLDTSSLVLPLVVRASSPNSPLVMFSYVEFGQSRANVTPITSVLLSQSIPENQTPERFYQEFSASQSSVFQQRLDQERSALQNADVGDPAYRMFDHFSGEFVANHQGYDSYLDGLDIRIYDDSVAIVENGSLLLATPDVETMYGAQEVLESTISGGISVIGGEPVSANIQATDLFTGEQFNGTSDLATQTFELELPRFGLYQLTVSAAGYQTVTYDHLSTFSATTNISVALIPVVSAAEINPVEFSARVLDATSQRDSGVAEVAVKLRSGLNNQYGEVVYTATTAADGSFVISSVEPGVYTVELSAPGFYTAYKNTAVVSSMAADQQFSLRPEFDQSADNDAEMSIILTWDLNPRDLDSHLTGPSADGGSRFHVYYWDECWADTGVNSNANCSRDYDYTADGERNINYPGATVYLDRDDTSSYGPETITVHDLLAGEYNYYVHHYSGAGSIATTSQAQVVVIDKFGQEHTFYPPLGGMGDDDVWHVFKVDSNGQVVAVNHISTNSDLISEDIGRSTMSVSGHKDNLPEMFRNLPAK